MENTPMQPISSKKLIIIVLIMIVLSRLDTVTAVLSNVYGFFSRALQPFHDMPPRGQFVDALLILLLLYITIFKLLYDRRK
jgi:uncharacterized protein YggT (Ycf19 family)